MDGKWISEKFSVGGARPSKWLKHGHSCILIIMKDTYRQYIFYGLLFVLIFGFFKVSTLGGWDQSFYWAQLTSVWYDRDLTLHNDLLANRNPIRDQYRTITDINQNGALPNTFSIGTAFVDGMYAGVVVGLHKILGFPRMSQFFGSLIAIATIFKIWLLVIALQHLLHRYDSGTPHVYLAIFSVFLGTPLLFYALNDYAMSHLNSALLATLCVLAFIAWIENPTMSQSLVFGIIVGMMILVRWQNVLYVFLVMPLLCYTFFTTGKKSRLNYIRGSSVVVCVVLTIASLQLIAFYKQFGVIFQIPQGNNYISWTSPQWMPFLFSGYHGVIPWTPVIVVSIIGLGKAFISKRGMWRWFLGGSLVTVLATLYLNACVIDWWSGWSYGARRLCCLLPLLAIGAYHLLKSIKPKLAIILCLGVVLWAHFTYTCYRNRIDDLAVPLLGRQSYSSVANDTYWITDPQEARAILQRKLPAPHYSGAKLWKFKHLPSTIEKLFSAIVIVAMFFGAKSLFILCQKHRTVRKFVMVAMLSYTASWLCVMGFFFPASYRLNPIWKQYLEGQILPDEAIVQGLPVEPVRFIEALSLVSNNQIAEAEKVLQSINTRDYRNLTLEELMKFSKENGGS